MQTRVSKPAMLNSKQNYTSLITIAVLATIAYLPSFSAGFVYDDHFLVKTVEAYQSFDVKRMLAGLGNGLEYLPVRDLSLALDAYIWGQNPEGYHLANFLYFVLLLWLLYRVVATVAARLESDHPQRIAFITTLIFALHPLNTEAVAFIAARNNILALLFILVSLIFFLAGADGRRGGFIFSLLAYMLALLSKASAVFYPAALILVYVCLVPRTQQRRPAWAALAALLVLAVSGALLHAAVAGHTGIAQPEITRYGVNDLGTSLIRAALVPAFYLRYFLVPWPQSVSYDEIELLKWAHVGIALALYAGYLAAFLLTLRLRRQQPLLLVGLCWFYAALVPVSNIFPTFPFVADRYLFPGMPGLALIAATALASIRGQPFRWLLLAVLAFSLLMMTHLRSRVWQSDLSLWQATWEVTPQTAAQAYFYALVQHGQLEKALMLAEAEQPQTYRYPLLLCESHHRASRYAAAVTACRDALERSAGYSPAVRLQINLALARAEERAGDVFDALHHYLQVTQERSVSARLFFQDEAETAVARLQSMLAPREAALRQAATSQPQDVRAQGELGLFLLKTGRYTEASEQLQRAQRLQPDNWQISYNLGLAAIKSGDLALASRAFQQVPGEEASYAEGLNHLARQFGQRGETALALDHWQRAVALQPANRNYRYNLARHHLRMGSREQARIVLERGISAGAESDRSFYLQMMENLGI